MTMSRDIRVSWPSVALYLIREVPATLNINLLLIPLLMRPLRGAGDGNQVRRRASDIRPASIRHLDRRAHEEGVHRTRRSARGVARRIVCSAAPDSGAV